MSNGGSATDVVSAGNRAVNDPASRALGYGDKATSSGTKVAQAPAKAAAPGHVQVVKAVWDRMGFNTNPDLRGVRLYDIASAPSKAISSNAASVGAWTNSSTAIYVDKSVAFKPDGKTLQPEEVAITVVVHEQWHIRQFAESGGPPKTFCLMMEYERRAYGATALWLRIQRNIPFTPGRPDLLTAMAAAQQSHGDAFKAKIAEMDADGLTGADREQACKDFLTLPDDGGDVYLPAEAKAMSSPTPLYK